MTTEVALLKSPDYAAFAKDNAGRLPYRIDTLTHADIRIIYSDRTHHGIWTTGPVRRVLSALGPRGRPLLDTVVQWKAIRRAPVTVAMFESQGHPLALLRSLLPGRRRRRRLVIIACWLADIAPGLSNRKRAVYRRMYDSVDLVIVFSANQREILERELGIAAERIAVVLFGIDQEEFATVDVSESGAVVAVGRDAGRDWPTLFDAVRGTEWDVKVACRERSLIGLHVPAEVDALGYIDRAAYGQLIASASVVVIATEDRAYPTGQSVMLEAMAMGKACVVTRTPAMADYAVDDANCLTVPTGDPAALRDAVGRLLHDTSLRERLGRTAERLVAEEFNARRMWDAIGALVLPEGNR